MSVIIRLQNLPWSASALDIRQYFHGLAIPEGGVHIVGGEQGDAFIAFSTDEDARQAMLMDGGKIKDAVVRLHLSSRSQMQKVIEDARQSALQPFLQIPASVPQTLPPVQSTASLMGHMAQMNHMGGQISSQLTSQMALATGQIANHMLQVLPGQLTPTSALTHSMMNAGQVAAPGSRGMQVASSSLSAASIGDAGAAGAATPLGARFPYGGMVMGGAMMGGSLGVAAGASAALSIAGAASSLRQPVRDSPAVEEDADDRKDDDVGRRRDRRERSRSRERRDRDRYRDRDRSSYDRRRRSRERSRDRGRRRRSRSTSRSRDRNARRSSRDKRDHDRSNEGPDTEANAVSGTGLLKTPERQIEGAWNQQSQVGPILRGQRDEGPASGLLGAVGSVAAGMMGGPSGRLGGSAPQVGMSTSLATVGMVGSSLRGQVPNQGGLPMRNGPGGFGGMGAGSLDGVRRPNGPWMQRDNLPPDAERHQDSPDDRRNFSGPGAMGPGSVRMGSMFNRPGADSDSMGRTGMGMPSPNYMDRAGGFSRPGMVMSDRPGLMDRFRPNGFERSTPIDRPAVGMIDRMRPNTVGPSPNVIKDRFPEMDNGDEDYEEQDMDMEDPFPDTEESCEEERNNQPANDNARNQLFSGTRPEPARDERFPYRDDRYDRSRRNDRDREHDRDRGRDSRDRRDRDRYRPRSNERERDRGRDSRYDRHGKDEFGRDRPDERYSKDHRYKDRPPEPNTCIEIRNMTTHTGYGDIRRFFQPLVIPGPGLKLINDETGRRTGVAYIRFNSRRDRDTALTYSKLSLKGESILISDLSDEIFENAIDSFVPERDGVIEERQPEKPPKIVEEAKEPSNESSNQYTCVVVHNAPNYAKDDDIRRLFKYCSLDVFWEVSKEGRRQKLAYVKFKKTEDCKRFLFANSKFQIGNNDIKVVGLSEKEYDDVKQRVLGSSVKADSSENKPAEQKPTELNSGGTAAGPETKSTQERKSGGPKPDESPEVICVPDDDKNSHEGEIQNKAETPREEHQFMIQASPQRPLKPLNTDCVCLRNLPPNAIDRDILDFFSDVGLVPLKIHIMVDYMRNPIGEAFCEFQDGHETARAATKHNSHMGKYVVSVNPVSRADMNNSLNISSDSQPGEPPMMMGGPPSLMGGSPSMMGGPAGNPMGQSRPPFHGPPGGHFNHGPGGHPGFIGPRGPGGPGGLGGPGRPGGPVGPAGPGPLMRGGPNNQGLLMAPMGPPGRLQLQDMSAEGFGRPGCVVACENIPFRADIDDILEYFCDYNLNHNSVIRRFNDRGLPTGDARISFNSPAEAQSAMRDLQFKKLQGRSIYMRII